MHDFTPTTPIAPYFGWTRFTPALPSFYSNVYSREELIKKMCMELHKLCEYANMLGDNINLDHELINELQDAFNKFMQSGFNDYYKAQVIAWINSRMQEIIKSITGHVHFGLTDDGYFCAYIPEGWEDIEFDTGMVYGRSDYGRLILRMNVDGDGIINNTYSYSLNAKPSTLEQLIRDLELVTNRSDEAYEALFSTKEGA